MGVSRAWYVRCDDCGNPAEVATDSAGQAREYARAQGFVTVKRDGRTIWLCPWGCRQRERAARR